MIEPDGVYLDEMDMEVVPIETVLNLEGFDNAADN